MAYAFKQIIYNTDGSNYNVPNSLTKENINKILKNYTPIYHLGIRTIPGTKIFLNKNTDPIIIGFSGVFEIDFTDLSSGSIGEIKVEEQSLNKIAENNSAYLIFDMIYMDRGSEEL